jgi:hypothetical protein
MTKAAMQLGELGLGEVVCGDLLVAVLADQQPWVSSFANHRELADAALGVVHKNVADVVEIHAVLIHVGQAHEERRVSRHHGELDVAERCSNGDVAFGNTNIESKELDRKK